MALATNWTKGETSVFIEALCCPDCGSLRVLYYGKSRKDGSLVHWECHACSHRWKGSRPKVGRATAI